jgi:hypothetical protein
MHSDIRPLSCSPKLTPGILSLLLTAFFNLLGCSIADRAALLDANYRAVQRVIDGAQWLWQMVSVCVSSAWTRRKPSTLTNPLSTFAKDAAAFTHRMVEGKRVRLGFDPANAPRAHKDSTQQKRASERAIARAVDFPLN